MIDSFATLVQEPVPVHARRVPVSAARREQGASLRSFEIPSLSLRLRQAVFMAGAALCLIPWTTPPIALALGTLLALVFENPFARTAKRVSTKLLQCSVVLLGFSMDLPTVLNTGVRGAGLAAAMILCTFALGSFLGRSLGLKSKISTLISAGTAICGGSAIAAVGSVIGAEESEISVAMGTVFILNAVSLYLFPAVGHAFGLSQVQFGTWAGIAIHDISSVVGAGASYGLEALQTATAVKLSRALWIIPVALAASAMFKSERKVSDEGSVKTRKPWFIGWFVFASVARSFVPGVALAAPALSHIATTGMTLTLFLVGTGLSLHSLRTVGWRPFVQGLLLWIFVSAASLSIGRFL